MLKLPHLPPSGKPTGSVLVVGNTWSTLTRFSPEPARRGAVRTAAITAGEASAQLSEWASGEGVDVIVSVVPPVEAALAGAFPGARFLTAPEAPLEVLYADPATLGPDRVANALAARETYGAPVVAVDCGTATTFTLVDALGRLAGGAIAVGLATARDALAARTARLPAVELAVPPAAPATDTLTALQVGLVHGHAGLIRHLCDLIAPGVAVVLTGGHGPLLAPLVAGAVLDEYLTPRGGMVFAASCAGAPW